MGVNFGSFGNVEKNGKSGNSGKSNAFGTAHRPTPVFFIVVGYSEDFVKQTSRMIEKLSKSALRGCAWAKIKDERRE